MKDWKHPKTIIGDAAEGKHYYRRQGIEDKIWRELEKKNNVLFNAPRRTGKSSIMKYMAAHCPKNHLCIYKNISSDNTAKDFYARLFKLVVQQISRKAQLKDKFSDAFKSIGIENISASGVRFKEKLKKIDFKAKLLELIPKMKESDHRIILFLDEFPDVINNITKREGEEVARDILQTVRRLTQDKEFHDHIGLVLAGSIGLDHVVKKVDRTIVVNTFRRITLPPLSEKQPEEFMQFLIENASMNMSTEVMQHLSDKLHKPIPYFIQLLVEGCNDILYDQGKPDATKKEIDGAWKMVLNQHEHFQDWNDRLKTYCKEEYPYLMDVLTQTAHNNQITIQALYNLGAKHKLTFEYKALMDDVLIKDGYLEEESENKFSFVSPLLKEWWMNRYPIAPNE